MNILISYNWLKEYLDTKLSPQEFARLTTNAGNSVERCIDLASCHDGIVIGVIEQIEPHPSADRLKIVKTHIGKRIVDIVCGGKNIKEHQTVVVALPGAKVKWHGQGEYIELQETEIRGVKSYGMICAPEEIGFEKASQGEGMIWDLSGLTQAKPGTSFAEAMELEDTLFDIEVTTNRPDAASIIGQAREGSAVTGGVFRDPAGTGHKMVVSGKGRRSAAPTDAENDSSMQITIHDSDLCPHYQAVIIDKVKVGPSPWWLQKRLLLAGYKPINNVVDITNYVLHEYGQPLHAFDAAQLEGNEIHVRRAKKGETVVALNDQTYSLDSSMLVIADKKQPVAVAGVMGGKGTGIGQLTTRFVIEAATFDPVSIRRTSRTLNLTSDASTLFEKGLSTEATGPALARATQLIKEIAGGEVVSELYSLRKNVYKPLSFSFDPARACALIGKEIPEEEMVEILEHLGCILTKEQNVYKVQIPFWRDHDIEASVDFVEEIARVYGYDKLPSLLPSGPLPKATLNPLLIWERRIKEWLRGAGLTETYAYSFVSAKQLESYDVDPKTQAMHVLNPLSIDQEYLRPSLVPTMLTTIEANQNRFSNASLFELAPVYLPKNNLLPHQPYRLIMAFYGQQGKECFFEAKGLLERLMREAGLSFHFSRDCSDHRYHPFRRATLSIGEKEVAVMGQLTHEIAQKFGIDKEVILVDVDFDACLPFFSEAKTYAPIPSYPEVKRDLAFIIEEKIESAQIEQALFASSSLLESVEVFDVYQGKGVEEGKKSLAVHLSLRCADQTLTSDQADEEMKKITQVIEKTFSGTIRS